MMEALPKTVPIHKANGVAKSVPHQNGIVDGVAKAVPHHNGVVDGVTSHNHNGALQCNGVTGPLQNGTTDEVGNCLADLLKNGATLTNGSPCIDKAKKPTQIPSFLERSHIHIADPDRVKKMITNIIQDGPNKLQIIADWDYTVTIGHINGNKALSSWDVMEESSLLPSCNREEIKRINDIHMKAEFDHSMTPEEKMNDTIKWYRDIYDEVLKSKLTKETISEIVKASGLQLRGRSENLFEKLNSLQIPTMVVSAGFGDFICEIIKLYNINSEHITVISNFFLYNKENTIIGFTDPIYPFNKKEHTVNESSYYKKFIERSNAILIGDTVGDAKMDGGIIKRDNILKIGFLNGPEKNPEYLKMFKQYFDIVVEDDQTMDPLIAIIDALKL